MYKILHVLVISIFLVLFSAIPSFAKGIDSVSFDGIDYSISGTTNISDGPRYCILEDYGNVYVVGNCEVASGSFTFSWPASTYTPEANHQPGYGYLVVICTSNDCSGGEVDFINGFDSQLFNTIPHGLTSVNFDGTNYSISGITNILDGSRYCVLEDYGNVYIISGCEVTSGSFTFSWPASTYAPEANHQPGLGYNVVVCTTPTCSGEGNINDFIVNFNSHLFDSVIPAPTTTPSPTPTTTPSPGNIYEYPLPTNNAALTSISLGPDDKLWFAEQGSNKVGNITTDGFITEYPTSGAGDINVGPDGNLWFTQVFNNAVGKISPQGEITEYSIPNSNEPRDITAGPDGNLWFTQQSGNKITKMDTNGNILADYSLPNPDSRPRGITSGPDGNIWFAEENYPVIGRITPDGIITEFPTSNGTLDITTGPDGNLWFTVFQSNSIGKTTTDGVVTEYAIPTDNSGPYAITTGPDHNLWFTQTQSNKIAKIDINGIFTEYNVPTLNSRPFGITSGPDGNIWFTEFNSDKIGRLYISAPNTPTGNNINYNENNVSLTYSSVLSSGNTAITTSQTGNQPPTGFRLGNPPTYYNISTTAVFSGNVQVCIDYTSLEFHGNENNLKLMHYDPTAGWTNITTSLDTVNNILCGNTASFSDFAIMTAPTIQDLIDKVQEMNLHQGIENSLDAKLQSAQEALNANNNGNSSTALNKLNSFINEVEAQRGNKISNSQADELHYFASNLIKLIQNIIIF